MTTQEREQFEALLQRQEQLEEGLSRLRTDLKEWELRTKLAQPAQKQEMEYSILAPLIEISAPIIPPPLPTPVFVAQEQVVPEISDSFSLPGYVASTASTLEQIVPGPDCSITAITPSNFEAKTEETIPPFSLPPLPEIQPQAGTDETKVAEDDHGGIEFQFGRWLARIGVVFALITLISFSTLAYKNFYHYMGPWSKLTVLALVSSGLVAAGLRIERKNPKLTVYGRTLAGGGLACLYYTLYGATYVSQLQVIHCPLLGGCLLLAWSAYVLYLAERKKSELLSVFSIALAYFSSAITPVGEFTMAANLILSVTAVIFLVRNAWTSLSYLCLIGTYLGLLQQFVVYDSSSIFWYEIIHRISFGPAAFYLAGAWVIYTAGVFLATTPDFASGKRMAFLCLNNGALIGLLTTASYLTEFGHIGAILCLVGGVFMATSYLAKQTRSDASDLVGAYLTQGLSLVTGGLTIAYTGVTRGLLITVESVFLAAAGAFSRNFIMRAAGWTNALLGTGFLLNEISPHAAHPWALILGGAAAMITNAWLARRDYWQESSEVAGKRLVCASAYYVLLATALLGFGILDSGLSEVWSAPIMAVAALILTFSVYFVPLIELPLLIQILILFALGRSVFPLDDSHVWWSESIVGLVTMILVIWWPRQKFIPTDSWLQPMMVLYALGMVTLSACAVHPHVDSQGWMMSASLLSLGFLLFGIYARTWSFALAGQLLLATSIHDFFAPINGVFPWTWWAAAVPIAVTFLTSWLVQEWLKKTEELPTDSGLREIIKIGIYAYHLLTLALIVRLVFALVPDAYVPLSFFAFGTALIGWNLKWPSSLGVRCGILLDVFGTLDYSTQVSYLPHTGATWVNGMGLLFLLGQSALLRRWGMELITTWENSSLTFLASLLTSNYVYWVIRPVVSAQQWLIATSVLSVIFLAYSLWTRTWQFAISSQIYLAFSVCAFFNPPSGFGTFPWSWWAAALPPALVFLTGWFVHQWLPQFCALSENSRGYLKAAAYLYEIASLVLMVVWIFGIVPAAQDTLAIFLLATGILLWNLRWPSAFGARAGLTINLVGAVNYLSSQNDPSFHIFSAFDAWAFTLFLAQPALLRRWGRDLISEWESWAVVLISAGMAWVFVSNSIEALNSRNMTLAWAVYALVLTVVGFAANERRQRWCGLAILLASIIRVGVYDFWSFSDIGKVLTFFVLTIICLGLSFLYYKFADRLKEWL